MSAIVWCPCCGMQQVSHRPHGQMEPHDYPTTPGVFCPGTYQVGLTGAGLR